MNTRPTIDQLAYSKNVLDRAKVLRDQEEAVYGQDLTQSRHRRLIAMNFIAGESNDRLITGRGSFTPEMLAAIELVTLALQILNGSEKLSALAAAAKEIDVLSDYLGYHKKEALPVEKLPTVVTGDRALDPVDPIEKSISDIVAGREQ